MATKWSLLDEMRQRLSELQGQQQTRGGAASESFLSSLAQPPTRDWAGCLGASGPTQPPPPDPEDALRSSGTTGRQGTPGSDGAAGTDRAAGTEHADGAAGTEHADGAADTGGGAGARRRSSQRGAKRAITVEPRGPWARIGSPAGPLPCDPFETDWADLDEVYDAMAARVSPRSPPGPARTHRPEPSSTPLSGCRWPDTPRPPCARPSRRPPRCAPPRTWSWSTCWPSC